MRKAWSVFLPMILAINFVAHAYEYFEIESALSALEQLTSTFPSPVDHDAPSLSKHDALGQKHHKTSDGDLAGLPLGDLKNIKNWSINLIADLFTPTMYRAHEEFILTSIDKLFLDYARKLKVESDVDSVSFFIAYVCIFNAVYMSISMTSLPLMDSNLSLAVNTMNDMLNAIKHWAPLKKLPTNHVEYGFDDGNEFFDSDSDDASNEEDNIWPSSLSLFYEFEKKRADAVASIMQRAQKFKNIKMGGFFDEYHVGKILVFSLMASPWVMDNFLTPYYKNARCTMNSSSMRIQAQSMVHMLQSYGHVKDQNTKNPYLHSLKVLLGSLVN